MKPIATISHQGTERALVQRFRLTALSGAESGRFLVSSGERMVIGTDPGADLVLDDRTVSRFHCEVAVVEGAAQLRDLGSHNGTRVNGVRVVQAFLEDGAALSLGRAQLRFDLEADSTEIPLVQGDRFGLMAGQSPAMRAVFHVLACAAESDATVLLEGETGTGKELAAESVHQESRWRDGPFAVVDCGSIPPQLLESELFGHERGAFTGAIAARTGAFEAASGGTIFLDEIGELGPDLQPKLLRVLERREVKRVGANRTTPIDVRVVAATNRNLREEVNAGRFRSDLYYRLAVVVVRLPPLRERLEDLPFLVECILEDLGVAGKPEAVMLTTGDVLGAMARHPWRGNVRELRNYLERCLAMGEEVPLEDARLDAEPRIDTTRPLREARQEWVGHFERRYLREVLRANGGSVAAAARQAGMHRIHMHRLLTRYRLR